ncbi:MAG TPA: GIY-YIG nuclease family protein [Acidocella sp.]|nr:GIY-YIG nuclease family protein [Acidocella sp.]HUM07319.1 GIY-YIG nuclease family protein [Acidocella sp.]
MKQPAVYIVASRKNGTIYTGVTSNLIQRIAQHRDETTGGFTAKYGVKSLVWLEIHGTMEAAILREKQIKAGSRAAKVRLIMETNPDWLDLYDGLLT